MAWNDLSMKEKAAYMKVAVANGITNLDDISNAYNSFADGGPLSNNLAKPFSYEPIPAVRYDEGGVTNVPNIIDTFDQRYQDSLNHFSEVLHSESEVKKPSPVSVTYNPEVPPENNIKKSKADYPTVDSVLPTDHPLDSGLIVYQDIPTATQIPIEQSITGLYEELPYGSNLLEANSYLNSQEFKKDTISKLKSLTKEEVKNIQASLADSGYFDINTDRMSKEEIKELQRKLYNKGFLTGDKEKAIDGIWGKKSIAAYRAYNIDGIVGNRTINSYLNSVSPETRWKNEVSTSDTEWCAEWVGKKINNATGKRWEYGIGGDAWQMPQKIVEAGGSMLYNIYENPKFNSIHNATELKHTTEEVLKTSKFDISQLQIGDVVGIYMPSSNMHETALQSGTTYNTHVGVVTGIDQNGIPIIEHNIHRVLHKDPANKLTGSKTGTPMIATVSRPNYNKSNISQLTTFSGESEYTKEDDHPLFKEYANSIAGSKDIISKLFPTIDINAVEQATLAVQGRETGFMRRKASDVLEAGKKEGATLNEKASAVAQELRVLVRDKGRNAVNPEQISSNLNKMKLGSFSQDERALLGLVSPDSLNDPKLAGRAALYFMAKNADYFKRLQQAYPELGITDDDIIYLTELSYNQGMEKLKSIGFSEEGKLNTKELEAIREMALPDARIKDITSTNLNYAKRIGEIPYKLASFLYDNTNMKLGPIDTTPFQPYISAAEMYRNRLIETKNSKNEKKS